MYNIVLAGNPNVGKSSIFNILTGLNHHTGNWAGKTINNTYGHFTYDNEVYRLYDIPGTYSLNAQSEDERIAKKSILFQEKDLTIVVTDASSLEKNLNLVLQILEVNKNIILVLNMIDEIDKKNIKINIKELENILKIPVIATSTRKKYGIDNLKKVIKEKTHNEININHSLIKYEIIEEYISLLTPLINNKINNHLLSRFLSIKILENDIKTIEEANNYFNINLIDDNILKVILSIKKKLIKLNIDYRQITEENIKLRINKANEIYLSVVSKKDDIDYKTLKIDKIITSKKYGILIMFSMLLVIFWITLFGANYISDIVSLILLKIQNLLLIFLNFINAPSIITNVLMNGVYKTLSWVVSVMLPPMAIFFPLFAILEDLGYLPRVAFNLDNFFKKASSHGKQALTMMMGFGCNACGVMGARIIDSPKEKLIAIITNNFVPCNGRFPGLIAVISMFLIGSFIGVTKSLLATIILVLFILFGIYITLLTSKFLSRTILKGIPSTFTLELPPYRKPDFKRIIIRSILDKTLKVLLRAVICSIPAGIIIWLMANLSINNNTLLELTASFLNSFGNIIGLDGYIILAFILGLPANEIVIPIIIMSYMASDVILDITNLTNLKTLLIDNGWTIITAINFIILSLFHYPCATTLLTIKKETNSFKWTFLSFVIPTIIGIVICFIFTATARLFI